MGTVRVLCSSGDEAHQEIFGGFVRLAAGGGVSVALLVPRTICESDLLEIAAAEHWDIAILLLNNIRYQSGDRTTAGILRDATNLVATMKQHFKRPLVCFCGLDMTVDSRRNLMEAKADATFPVPCDPEYVLPGLSRILDEVSGFVRNPSKPIA